VKEKQPTSAQHVWELFKTVGKAFLMKLVEIMKSCHSTMLKN
jgi:hypothetical protein